MELLYSAFVLDIRHCLSLLFIMNSCFFNFNQFPLDNMLFMTEMQELNEVTRTTLLVLTSNYRE